MRLLFTLCLRTTAMLGLLLTALAVHAQFTTISTVPTFTNNNGSGQVTFNFQNTNPYPIRITEIRGVGGSSGNQAASVWFKPTPINGAPGIISTANGWTEAVAGNVNITTAQTSTAIPQTFFSGMNFQIPAGQTYGLMVYCNGQRYHTISTGLPTITFSGGGCNLIAGTNISYGGGVPNSSAPTFTPRGWLGEVVFEPVSTSPCVAPPTAGTASASVNPVCLNVPFSVSLTGGSTGIGLTYQWSSSTNNVTYTNIPGAINSTYFVTNGIAANTWFRCTVTCSGQSASSTVLVNTISNSPSCPPSFYNSNVATGGNSFPLNSSTNQVQWIYAPGVFNSNGASGVPAFNGLITTVYFRTTNAVTTTFSNFEIKLGQTVGTQPNFGSTSGTQPFETGLTQVFFASSLPYTTQVGWNAIQLQTPFQYDPALSLIFEMRVTSTSGGPTVAQVSTTGSMQRKYAPHNSASGTANTGLVDFGFNMQPAAPCTAPPTAGTINTTSTSVCPSTPFNLNLSGASFGSGQTYQWFSSPDNVTYTPIPLATFASYTAPTGITSNTWYRCTLTCSGQSSTTPAVQMTVSSFLNCYCASSATSTADEDILNVSFGSMSNSSTCTSTGGPGSVLNQYSDYTATVAPPSVQQSEVVNFSIQNGTCGGNFGNNTKVFIDWNRNGLFTDAGEEVYASPNTVTGPNTRTDAITVPFNASPGQTRMRVITVEISSITAIVPCGTYTWGETEDYLINVVPAAPCTSPPTAGTANASATSVCPNLPFNLSLSGNSIGTGQTYQWQSSPDNVTYTNITGATTPLYTLANGIAANTWFRCVVTCSGQSSNSTPVQVTALVGSTTCPPSFFNGSTGTSANSFPLNSTTSNQVQWIYAPTVFNSNGPSGVPAFQGLITTVFFRTSSANTVNYTNFEIKLGQTVGTQPTWSSGTFETGLTQVFFAPSYQLTSVAGGWTGVTLQTPFLYNPALSLVFELRVSGGTGISVLQLNTTGSNQRIWGLYGSASGTSGTGLVDFGFNMIPATPCSGTPTAGTVVSSSPNVCANTAFNLGLSGATTGTGLSYQWEVSPNGTTGWTNVPGGTLPVLSTTQAATSFYRCTITCTNSSQSDTSPPLQVVSPSLVQGNFTINAAQPTGGTNFQTFNDAVNYISCGIGGPVVFDVVSGIYNEQITLGNIGGTSPTNTITFRNAASNTTPAELRFDGTSANNYVVNFTNGAQHIRFDGLTLSSINATYGRVFSFFGTNSFLTIENCILNSSPVTTTSTLNAVMFFNSATTDVAQNITIRNNQINNGSYGIYFYGNTTTKEANNSVLDNNIQNFYYMGVYFYYHQDGVVSGNTIVQNNPGSTTVYGLYYYFCDRGAVEGNRVVTQGTSTNYAMYIYQPLGGSLNPVKIANNMASALGNATTNYALFLYAAVNIDLFHNSLHVTGGSVASSAGLNLDRSTAASGVGGNLKIYNNIISNTSGVGPAVIIRYGVALQPMLSQMNYNNLYATGPIVVRRYATSTTAFVDYSTLQDWRTAGFFFDLNSVSVDPIYLSDSDLHVNASALNNAGDPGNSMPVDIDDDIRCPNPGCAGNTARPDIGADEFLLSPNDVSLVSISPPCPGGDIIVGIQNIGTAVLNTVVLNLSVNGVVVISGQSYNVGPVPSGGTDAIVVSGLSFTPGVNYSIVATLSAPNGGVDGSPNNNSQTVNGEPSLNGTYTIGGTGANYPDFTAAAAALNNTGVCGPVLFLVRPGLYNEQMNLNSIPGSSPFNFVVFAPDPAFSGTAEMRFQGSSTTNNYVLQLNGASYLAFIDLTFTHIANSTYGRVVNFTGTVENVTFSGNTFNGVSTTSTSTNFATINNNSGSANNARNIVFENNDINNGSYGFYWWGGTTTDLEPGNVFLNNEVRGFYYMGLYAYYQTGNNITGNIFVQEGAVSSTGYGIYTVNSAQCNINRNQVIMNSGSTTYGIFPSTIAATASDRSRVSNNFVVCKMQPTSGTAYGIYVSGTTSFLDVVHNSVHVTGGSTAARALYVVPTTATGAGNNRILNNIFASSGAGYAAYFSSATVPAYITQMDRNVLYTTGTNLGFFSTNQTTLAAWQAASPYDDNSLSVNPLFITAEDLHVKNPQLNSQGELGTAIFEDIDQEVRCPAAGCLGGDLRPDIGADEFEVVPTDIEAGVVTRPLRGKSCDYSANEMVEVTVINSGLLPINFANNPLTITVNITGASNQTVSRTVTTGSIQPFEVQFIEVGTANFTAGGQYNFAFTLSLPGDGRASNDANSNAGSVTVEAAVATYPYAESFNGFTLCSTAPQAACELSGGWYNDLVGENYDWIVNAGATPTTLSGPNSGLGNSGRYLYLEPDAANQRATLNSPCFNLAGLGCPALSFYYHMAGANTGSLRVDAQTVGGSWVSVWQLSGPQQANEADAWRRAEINLGAYLGQTVRFRFVATSAGVASDIALDEVSVYDVNTLAPGALDIAAITGQSSTCDEFVLGYNFSGYAPTAFNWSITPGVQGTAWRLLNGTTLNSSEIVLEFSTPGTYNVKMDATICGQVRSVTKTYTVVSGAPQASFNQNQTIGTTATTFTFTDNSYPQSAGRQWTFGPINRPGIPGFDYVFVSGNATSNPVSVRFVRPGPYSVRLFASSRCGISSFSRANWIIVTSPAGQEGDDMAGIDELPDVPVLEVFPNPFSQSFNVSLYAPAEGKATLRMNNMLGQVVYQRELQVSEGENSLVIDGSKLPVGVYILHLTQNGKTEQVKIVKE